MIQTVSWRPKTSGWLNISLCALTAAVLSACGGGSSDGGAAANFNGNGSNGGNNSGGTANIAGKLSYDFVPTATGVANDGSTTAKLDYSHIQKRPVRHALVEAVSEDGKTVLGKAVSDDAGAYSIAVASGTRAYIRVTSQISDGPNDAPAYLVQVRDNTAPQYAQSPASAPLYSMRGDAVTVAAGGMTIDLNAGSGWTGNSYGAPRTAAPFAILDQIVTAAQKMRTAAPNVALPPLNVFWSVNNRPTDGEEAKGFISTSHYDRSETATGLYILGAENVDTDEYDSSVLVHEFGHYLEATLSRSDSVGGKHAPGDLLDMRVAFGEAFGNAFSSMMRDTPTYTDTVGPLQAQTGIAMSLDTAPAGNLLVWANESAVGNFLYSLYTSPNVGFAPIYQALRDGERTTAAFTSVFSFATALRPILTDAGKSTLDALLAKIKVPGGAMLDEWGTYAYGVDRSDPALLPVYAQLTPGGSTKSCSTTEFETGNKLGNYGHVRMTVPKPGAYRLTLAPLPGDVALSGYTANVYRQGKALVAIPGSSDDVIDLTFVSAGDYVADVYSASSIDFNASSAKGARCVSVSLMPRS